MNGFIVTLVVLSFLVLRRAPKGPVKLELRDENEAASLNAREAKVVEPKPRPKFVDPRLRGQAGSGGQNQQGAMPTGWDSYKPRHQRVDAPAGTSAPPIGDDEDTAPGRVPKGASSGARSSPRIKSLNVLFNWNGHTWDAYEVLGIPAGSSSESAHQAFERAAALADKETLPFLRAAFEAIASQA